jgi:predicted MPP superfamily phosphohydrolase
MYAPEPHNPARYLTGASSHWRKPKEPDLPWEKLRDDLTAAGWLDLNNHRGRLTAGERDIALAGVHDSHIKRDRYEHIAGRADPSADLRIGVTHSPEPRLLDRFEADGYDLLLAGHTHGGQLCLPFYGALVTNCGIERERVSGLHRHPADGRAWLHISAGLGTSPWAPARFACRPEASLLTLVPRDAG